MDPLNTIPESPIDARRPAPRPQPGLFDSLQRLVGGVIAAAETRLELFAVDLAAERGRVLKLLIGALLAVFGAAFAVIFLSVLPVAYFWDDPTKRVWAVAIVMLFYVGLAVAAGLFARAQIVGHPGFFDATLSELRKDRDALRSGVRR